MTQRYANKSVSRKKTIAILRPNRQQSSDWKQSKRQLNVRRVPNITSETHHEYGGGGVASEYFGQGLANVGRANQDVENQMLIMLMGGEFGGEWGIWRLEVLHGKRPYPEAIQCHRLSITLGQQFNRAIVRNGELTPQIVLAPEKWLLEVRVE